MDGDGGYEHQINLNTLELNDVQNIIYTSKMAYEDYVILFKEVSENIWKKSQMAIEVSEKMGLNTEWYANFKQAYSVREQYHFGYWLNFYLYMDMRDVAIRNSNKELITQIDKAYFSGDWSILEK